MTIETVAALVAKLTTDLTAAQSAITQDIVNIRHLFTAGADTSAIENALNELDAKVNALQRLSIRRLIPLRRLWWLRNTY